MTTTTDGSDARTTTPQTRFETSLAQLREDCRVYNEAVGSFNTHLGNHRDRRDLHDLPFRAPVVAHDAFDDALEGDPEAVEALLASLIDQAHLDSQVRRHPETYPVHLEAVEQLRIARDRLVTTLEDVLQHVDEDDG